MSETPFDEETRGVLQDNRKEKYCQLVAMGVDPVEVGKELRLSHQLGYVWRRRLDIMQRIAEIKAQSADSAVMARVKRLERLSTIAEMEVKQPITAKEAVMAVAEINKMLGDYAPQKHQVAGEVVFRVIYDDAPKQLAYDAEAEEVEELIFGQEEE